MTTASTPSSRSGARRSSTRSRTTSTRLARWRSSSTWSPRATGGRCRGRRGLAELLAVVGLETLAEAEEGGGDAEAESLLAERERARAERDFERADRIRDELAQRGWEVRDTAAGARLVRRS